MDFGGLLVLSMVAGGLSLLGAGLVWRRDLLALRRARIARRYAGEPVRAEDLHEALGKPREQLLNPDHEGKLWLLFGISPKAFDAFRADQPRYFWIAGFGTVATVTLILVRMLGLAFGWALPIMAVLMVLALYLAISFHERRRMGQIEDRLPEAFDIVARCLRIGMPVNAALRVVAQDLSGVIAKEFMITADQISYGKEMVEALREMAQRTNSWALRFFGAAVAIQVETGGNLVDVVERLATLTRGRIQLQRKVRAMTAEAVWSGRFLSAFPVVAGAMIWLINPDYFENVMNKPYLIPLALLIIALLIANIIFMQRLVRFE